MVAKVGQNTPPVVSTSTPRMGGALAVATSISFPRVSESSASTRLGPEEQSLRFSEDWKREEFPAKGKKKSRERALVRFGGVLTTMEVSRFLVDYRTRQDEIRPMFTAMAAALYEKSIRVVANQGVVYPIGGNYSRAM